MTGIKIPYQSKRLIAVMGFMVGLGCACPFALAQTIDTDPFQVKNGQWMSFERYNDNIKRNRPVGSPSPAETPETIEPPTLEASTNDAEKTTSSPAPTVAGATGSSAPAVALPTRPLDLPILPGINKGYGIQINSTADNNADSPAHIVNTSDGQLDLHLREQNWQDAAETARQHADDKNGVHADSERLPLDVRMSFLPNKKIVPTPTPERKPRPRLPETPYAPKPAPVATAPQKSPAECAIDSYKQKQLEAIQSDRQTLQALQSAITDLGLQKQLNFMAGAQQSPNLSTTTSNAVQGSTPPSGTP